MHAKLNITIIVPEGETVSEVRERIQKFFTYYHPRYQAVVTADKSTPEEEVSAPTVEEPAMDIASLTVEECELLGIPPEARSLLS